MKFHHTVALAVTSAALVLGSSPGASAAPAGDQAGVSPAVSTATASVTVRKPLSELIDDLPVKAEGSKSGYSRGKFKHWVDKDGDCQNARAEVLRKESKKRVSGKCSVKTGRWVSMYDGKVITKASKTHVDHMVPLAEAWVSGAKKWNADTRRRFANDLGDYRSLIAVSASSNLAKGDRDPAEWLPNRKVCTYVSHWAAVKTRWSLSVSPREKRALASEAEYCSDRVVKVTKAKIVKAGTKKKPAPSSPGGSVPPSGWDCPASHPIKGNASSMIYHVPGGSFYDRTNPEECFASEAAARAAGYRRSRV